MNRVIRTILALMTAVIMSAGSAAEQPEVPQKQQTGARVASAAPTYPLKVSANGRYLIDQHSTPFLLAGDSPQALMVNLTEQDAELFFASRVANGFNAVWINLLCRKGTGGAPTAAPTMACFPSKLPMISRRPTRRTSPAATACFDWRRSTSCW